MRWLGFFSSKASMSHLLILNPLTYQRIMLIISELSRFDFICFIIYLLGSVIVFSQPFRIFLDILTPSSYNTSTFFFICSCHLIKPFPTKKVVPSLRSLCTCLYTSFCTWLLLFLLPFLCRQIISFLSIWSSLHLRKSSSYLVFLPLKGRCTFSYPNH